MVERYAEYSEYYSSFIYQRYNSTNSSALFPGFIDRKSIRRIFKYVGLMVFQNH